MSTGSSSINNAEDISITLDVAGGVNVHRALLGVTFNPVVVQAVDVNAGRGRHPDPLGRVPVTTVVGNVLQNDVNNTIGTITHEYTLTNPSGQSSGNGTVATVQVPPDRRGQRQHPVDDGAVYGQRLGQRRFFVQHGCGLDGRTGSADIDAAADRHRDQQSDFYEHTGADGYTGCRAPRHRYTDRYRDARRDDAHALAKLCPYTFQQLDAGGDQRGGGHCDAARDGDRQLEQVEATAVRRGPGR